MNMDVTQLAASFMNFLPEILLGSFFVIALLIDAFVSRSKRAIALWALLGFAAAGVLALREWPLTQNPFLGEWIFKASHQPFGQGMLVVDGFAIFFKVLIALAGVLVVLFSLMSRELEQEGGARIGEYYALMLAMTFGMFLMVGANDLLVMYLGIEIVSLCSYAIVGFTKKVPRASEASMKYVIYGGVSSAIMLFGISLVYGLIGTTNFGEIMDYLGTANMPTAPARPLLIASVMILAGLGYKISAVPFHFWAPDVYEGGPITMTAFLSVASKAAGFALLTRFIVTSYPATLQGVNWSPILAVLAVFTMTLGNLTALQQSNLKRLLAYSSIAHAGYMLMGLVVWTAYGVTSVLLYLAVYLIMNLGAFFAVQKLAEVVGSEDIEDFRGLGPRVPLVGVCLGIFMISLVGLPPTAGFAGKLFLFNALLSAGKEYVWLAVIGAINSVISLYYYLRVLKVLYLDKPLGEPHPLRIGGGATLVMGILAVATILFGLPNFFGPLLTLAQSSLGTLARMLQE